MKNTFTRLIGALSFSLLFYNQDFGLNLLLYAIIAIFSICIIRPTFIKRDDFIIAAILYFVSGVFVFTAHTTLSMVTYCITFLVFTGSLSGHNNTVYVQWFNGIYQSLLGAIHQRLHGTSETKIATKKYDYGFVLLASSIVISLVLLFTWLYGQANPILGNWISKVHFDFINIRWILTTIMGYILILNISSRAELDILTHPDRQASNVLSDKIIKDPSHRLHKEQLLGTISLVALNVLILLFIITDFWYLLKDPLSDATTLSKTVHEGVNALVISIIIAITTILILFRGDLNFYKKSSSLRALTYVWIAFNIVIIILTAYKNYLYSTGFGLTYKRIGVFIYLLLCISGMVTTYFKVARKHNFLFMIQVNARVAFLTLILISSYSWDRTITRYNLNTMAAPDIAYLLSLSTSNSDILYAYAKANPKQIGHHREIESKYNKWQEDLKQQTWQSTTLRSMLNALSK